MKTHPADKHFPNHNPAPRNEELLPWFRAGWDACEQALGKPKSKARPSLDEVRAYCAERDNGMDPGKFFDHYEANGWMVGRNPMKDWKAAVRYWEQPKSFSMKSVN